MGTGSVAWDLRRNINKRKGRVKVPGKTKGVVVCVLCLLVGLVGFTGGGVRSREGSNQDVRGIRSPNGRDHWPKRGTG